jgi:hypothetical protein
MVFIKFVTFLTSLFAFSSTAFCEVSLVDNVLIVKGALYKDLEKFRSIIKENPIKEVRFHDCYGGSLLESLVLNKMIEDRKIKTSFKGYCLSACAVAFMGGASRKQEKKLYGRNVIGFHAGRKDPAFPESLSTTDAAIMSMNRIMINTIARQSRGLLSTTALNSIASATQNHDGLFFITDVGILGTEDKTVVCSGQRTDGHDFTKCNPMIDLSLKKSGITTE